jgi:hypothetical protein
VLKVPERGVHNYTSRLLLGKSFDEVHRVLDAPVKFLGSKHRVLYHEPVEAALIGFEIAGFEGALAALMHVTVDELCSRDKRMKNLIKRVRSI